MGPAQEVPGALLPSTHAVDGEYAVHAALAGSPVPVTPTRLFCGDDTVIGTAFYAMDFLRGQVFTDRALAGVPAVDRGAMYDDMNRDLAALHGVDLHAAGLAEFGRPHGYVRLAAIEAGVYRRALDGNAADAAALAVGGQFRALAEAAWTLADIS